MAERPARRPRAKVREDVITLAHGGGGRAMRDLIEDVIGRALDNPDLDLEEDQARIDLNGLIAKGDRLAFTTDTYVVKPLFFPGGDIGKLAVFGTVNDLAVSGARPLHLSCGLVLEEGFRVEVLRDVLASMGEAAREAGVSIVTGDTKVVERGAADGMFINTSGIGVIPANARPSAWSLSAGDVILVSGNLGDHGASVLLARGDLKLEADILSDCQPLSELVAELLASIEVRAMRDATRGGLAAVLQEWAVVSEIGIHVAAESLPVGQAVRSLCEVLGFDPMHLANEGKLVVAVPEAHAERALDTLRAHPRGRDAARIGQCRREPAGLVTMSTGFGGERVVASPSGLDLPRIC